MSGLKLTGLLLVTVAFVTAIAIISTSYGVVLPKSLWVYWVFLLITLISGNLFLFSGTPLSDQSNSLFLISKLFFIVTALTFFAILLDLFGVYSADKTLSLWFFMVASGVQGGVLHFFGQDLENGNSNNK